MSVERNQSSKPVVGPGTASGTVSPSSLAPPPSSFILPPSSFPLPPDVVLSVRGVSKKFCRNLKRSMWYGMADLARGLVGARLDCGHLREEEFWALDEVSFDLKRGESLGIIGQNGSGKSTLLRVLTGIFPPDRGEVVVAGRVGGLIALTAGMHPHMTGIENVYLNGSIQGMTRREIDAKLDSIVEFAEIGAFINAPLSTYSSGMHVRLGFAVAIHCEPDILLLDEVLAVGDLAFQRKCFQRLEALRGSRVATVFISHNLRQVERMCDRALLLQGGRVMAGGMTLEVVDTYFKMQMDCAQRTESNTAGSPTETQTVPGLHFKGLDILDECGARTKEIVSGRPFAVRMRFHADQTLRGVYWALGLVTSDMILVGAVSNEFDASRRDVSGDVEIVCRFSHCPVLPGLYSLRVKVRDSTTALLFAGERMARLKVVSGGGMRVGLDVAGMIRLDAKWEVAQTPK